MNIIWTEQAKISYEKIIDNLIEKWNTNIAFNFENLTNEILDKLKTNKKLCPSSKQSQLRKCVIHENASLIYKISKQDIELITFIFNRSNHSFY